VPRKSGTAYEMQSVGDGKKRQRTFTVKREAERFALKVENAKEAAEPTAPLARSSKSVAAVVEASYAASLPKLKPKTARGYRLTYDSKVLPLFGKKRAAALTRADVQAWVNSMTAEGLAPATVRGAYMALNKAMKHALYGRDIAVNPCAGVALPRLETSASFETQFLTLQQVESVAAQLADAAPFDLLVRFLALTGLRAGEAVRLRIRDVNLRAGHVEVRQTLQRIDRQWVLGTPKSKRSTRDVPILDRGLLRDLKAYLLQHPHSGDPDALFWPGRAVGTHWVDYDRVLDAGGFRDNYFRPALTRCGLPPKTRVHDLRHTAASLWLAAGFSNVQVSRWLGHGSVMVAHVIYSHLYPTDYAQHLDRFDAFRASHCRLTKWTRHYPRSGHRRAPPTH